MLPGDTSMTARRVAAHRRSFAREPARFGHPDADQRLQDDVADGLDVPAARMTRYLQVRTTFFDRVVVRSIAGGITQIVAVGAGYDGRSLRYAKPGVRWFELDHPGTQADKRARLQRLGIDAAAIRFAPADFAADDAAEALREVGHDPTGATLFLCEGVAGYLDHAVLDTLLAALSRCSTPQSRLAITIALRPESPEQHERRTRLGAAVAGMGEPLSSSTARGELGAYLAATGWTVTRATDPAGVAIGESERASAFVVAIASG